MIGRDILQNYMRCEQQKLLRNITNRLVAKHTLKTVFHNGSRVCVVM